MKKNNKKKVTLLVLIIALLIILFAIEGLMRHIEKNNDKSKVIEDYGYETLQAQNPNENYVPDKAIKYSNISKLTNLKGELPSSTVTKIVKSVFVEEIPKVLNKVEGYNDTKLKEYYNSNKQELANKIRVVSEEDFIKMVETFSELKADLSVDFKSCDFTDTDGLGLTFTYENGEEVKCKIAGTNANLITFEF